MQSVWEQKLEMPRFPKLNGDLKTDVLVIGGGIAGILCAHRLQALGVDYTLVEAKTVCSGITKGTTAKITSQHGLIYHKIRKRYGPECALLYYRANTQALQIYRTLCGEISCDYAECPSFVYETDGVRNIERELETLELIGADASFTTDLSEIPVSAAGAVRFERQAQFHPLKFLRELSKNLRIYEHTKVCELMKGKAVTECGIITADKIIVATHFPMLNKHGLYFMKQYQHRSYVLALEKAGQIQGMYVDEDEKGLSFRGYGNVLLLGGGSHRTGKSGGNWTELETFAAQYYPDATVKTRWAAQDCMTLDGIPYIGEYSGSTPNLLVATGFQKWGMTTAMVAAQILGDLVQGKANEFASVFTPRRTMLHGQLAINLAESTLHLLKPTVPRCPHMGCALQYNAAEHSWDCACHGSRFSERGEVIDNPATDDKHF